MTIKNFVSMISILVILLWFVFMAPSSQGRDGQLSSEVLSHAGKLYPSVEDPGFISYDEALRTCLAERIKKEFGVALDLKKYSGFDLLEIDSLFKCKKADEPFEDFLKGFPKHR